MTRITILSAITAACLLLAGVGGALLRGSGQAEPITRAQIDTALGRVIEPGFIQDAVAEMNLPERLRPHAAAHLAALWSDARFRDRLAQEIARNQAALVDASGAVSVALVHRTSTRLNGTLLGAGLHRLPASEIRVFLETSAAMMRAMPTADCLALTSGHDGDAETQMLEMQALARLSEDTIESYFNVFRAGILAGLDAPAPAAMLSAPDAQRAQDRFDDALQTAISRHPDRDRLQAALASFDGPMVAEHCDAMILIFEQSARIDGEIGDLVARWFAQGMIEHEMPD